MAGRLVADYGVGSEDDEPITDQAASRTGSGGSSSSNSAPDKRKKPPVAENSKTSSRSTYVKEVESSRRRSRSGSRERRDKHHHHRSSKSKKDRHRRRSRSRSRSRSRDRRRRTRSRSKSRSKSRDRRRRNHRDDRRKRRSRSKSRSSRSRSRSSDRRDKKSALQTGSNDATNATGIQKGGLLPTPTMQVGHQVEPATQAAILAAQKLLQSQLNQVNQPATVPSFYNQTAVNTSKIAEQMQKRKLLWANKEKKEAPTTAKIWEATAFNQDQDGKMTAKFKRLMGIKHESDLGESSSATSDSAVPDVLKKQQELFATLDQQYEVARATTHTQRGLGLGFSSSGFHFPR